MGPPTYKAFNIHFSIRCETYNSSVSPSIHRAPLLQRKLLLACIIVATFSATNRHKELVPPLLLSPQRTDCLCRILRRIGALIPLLGHEGIFGDRPHLGQNNHISEIDTTLVPKTLRLYVYGPSHL